MKICSLMVVVWILAIPGMVLAQSESSPPLEDKTSTTKTPSDKAGEQPKGNQGAVPPPANWKPAGEVTSPVSPAPQTAGEPKPEQTAPGSAGGSGEVRPVPPPSDWKPAGEITGPGATASAESKAKAPGPLFSYGDFQLDVHGRIQLMTGLVGQDAAIENGDLLNRDGFRLLRTRLMVQGQLLAKWEFQLEAELLDRQSGGNALIGANITYQPSEYAWVRAGVQKPPFSRTLLGSSGSMQFIERPVWVVMERATDTMLLDLDRQVGLAVGAKLALFSCSVGAFNGTPNFSLGNMHDGLLYVVRLEAGQGDMGEGEADHQRGSLRWSLGANGYINNAGAANVRGAGADAGLKLFGVSFYAEAVWAKSVPTSRPEGTDSLVGETERWGMMAQAGYLLPVDFAELELAVRFAMMDDNVHLKDEGDLWLLTAGINAYLHGEKLKLMLNYMKRQELHGADLSNDGVFAMLQLKF